MVRVFPKQTGGLFAQQLVISPGRKKYAAPRPVKKSEVARMFINSYFF
jgi:hypothetical protein